MPEHDADHEIAHQAAADVARLFNRPALIKVVELARAVSKATPPLDAGRARGLKLIRP